MVFNTTPFHGKLARVEKNDVKVEFTEGWELNIALDMDEVNRQGQNWKEALPGQAGWDGSFTAQLVAGNTEQKAFLDNLIAATPGVKLTDVKFLLDTDTNAFTGNIYITRIGVPANVSGKVMVTFGFQGDGALTLTDTA